MSCVTKQVSANTGWEYQARGSSLQGDWLQASSTRSAKQPFSKIAVTFPWGWCISKLSWDTPPPGPAKRCQQPCAHSWVLARGSVTLRKPISPRAYPWQLPEKYVLLPSLRLKLCSEQLEDWAAGSAVPKSASGALADLMKQCLFDKCF